MNTRIATALLGIVALIVVLVFLFLPAPETPKAETPPAAAETQSSAPKPNYPAGSSAPFEPTTTKPGTARTSSSLPPGAAWEDKLDELLTNETDNATTVRGLVSSMRGLPAEAQEEFIAHAVNLCEDEQFGLIANIYLDPSTTKEVSETIFNDALNRPDEIKLPLLAKTLRNPAHPMAGEAKEILEMYLDLEPGAVPPNGWEQAVSEYIKKQNAP